MNGGSGLLKSPELLPNLAMRTGLLLLCLFMTGCEIFGPDYSTQHVDLDVPAGFDPIPVPELNPMTPEKVVLGERLFFDPILSRDQTVSCGTCHLTNLAFSDGLALSIGIDGRTGIRNSPSLVNVAYQPLLFWDGGALTLENQVFAPLQDHNEMDANLDEILVRLNQSEVYAALFQEAFDEEANLRTLTQALGAFQRTIRSGGSRYDQYIEGEEEALSESESRGLALFEGKAGCITCHSGFLLTTNAFENNGLTFANADSGRARVTLKSEDFARFRVPSLRNVAVTSPYMHDGRLETLQDVVAHYNHGGNQSRGQHESIMPLKLSDQEQADLVSFLNSLTDVTVRFGLHN